MAVKRKRKTGTRAAGTMTESQFWSMIRASLRKTSRYWKPISICRMKARRKYTGSNKKQKYEYLCNGCKKWFPASLINVDHIIPVGTLNGYSDLSGFVERLFCEADKLQVLCNECHNDKTSKERNDDA